MYPELTFPVLRLISVVSVSLAFRILSFVATLCRYMRPLSPESRTNTVTISSLPSITTGALI